MVMHVVVVGGGVIGLSSALAILEQIPGCRLTVISDSFSPNTTGDVAAGIWAPYLPGGTSEENIDRWAKVSWDHLQRWYESGEWEVLRLPGSIVEDTPMPTPSWHHIPAGFRRLSEEECRTIAPHCVSGYTFTSFVVEPSRILPKLARLIEEKGGKFEKFFSQSDISKRDGGI
ncbi:FAD dependent oxidoreductase [Trinorchestia longiramus]|nr:FAD dependent oxidoreductase [Trinorchestia longiramus]